MLMGMGVSCCGGEIWWSFAAIFRISMTEPLLQIVVIP
jgi:hypothetical protein